MLSVAPLLIQSQSLTFAEWISLSTLCLAPLIAHILAGAPQPSLLVRSRPKWHDRMCLLNPTSILCRYAAIADRRLRAHQWEAEDAAAANAVFWTGNGWDGSESMVVGALPSCTLLPEHGRVELISTEMLKTVIVTMQGVQALVTLVGGVTGTVLFNNYFGLDGIFGPLSVMGLMRLFAAPWLTDAFMYSSRARGGSFPVEYASYKMEIARCSIDSLILTSDTKHLKAIRYRSVSYWPSRCLRVLYLSIILGCCSLAAWWTFIRPSVDANSMPLTTSSFLPGILYAFGLAATAMIYFYYYIWGNATSTLLPCASQIWYKVYTVVLMTFMAVVILTSAIETHKTTCGAFTSLPARCADVVCATTAGEVKGASANCF